MAGHDAITNCLTDLDSVPVHANNSIVTPRAR
jgi:hypothetical protein